MLLTPTKPLDAIHTGPDWHGTAQAVPKPAMSRVEMKNRTTQILYSYWNEVRHGRLAPKRFDIEPARIAGILAETMILERADDSTLRFRLAGTRIAEQFAAELRGQNFFELWGETDRTTLRHQLTALQEQGGALRFDIDAATASGRTVAFEAILLPLVHTRDIVDRFLGSISCAHLPLWLGTEPLTTLRLTASETIWPDGRPHAIAERLAHPPALNPSTAAGRIVRFDRRQFRVLDGGRDAGGKP